jgi:hypothetical protein
MIKEKKYLLFSLSLLIFGSFMIIFGLICAVFDKYIYSKYIYRKKLYWFIICKRYKIKYNEYIKHKNGIIEIENYLKGLKFESKYIDPIYLRFKVDKIGYDYDPIEKEIFIYIHLSGAEDGIYKAEDKIYEKFSKKYNIYVLRDR